MKERLRFFLFILIVALVLYIFLSHLLQHKITRVNKISIVSCPEVQRTLEVKITQNGFLPSKLEVPVCSRVVFKNQDHFYHQAAFGDHPDHLLYPGFNEKVIYPNGTNEFIATAVGTYKIHDHLHEKLEGVLIIRRR